MRILHCADIHIGEMGSPRIDQETGLYARSLDFLKSFENIVDIGIEKQANVLLIVGDLFTKVNPHPRYILEVVRKLKKATNAGIKTIIVSGNHETPRMATTINPLALLGEIEGVTVALDPTTLQVDGHDFVCVPSPSNFDETRNLFDPLLSIALRESKSSKKILASHMPLGQATTCSEVSLESFLGDCVDINQIPPGFKYVALGHIHRCQQIDCAKMPVYYSGSSERFEFSEENENKYVLLVDIEKETNVEKIKLPIRPMMTIINEDCAGLSATKIVRKVMDAIDEKRSILKDCFVRIKLDNIEFDESKHIDWPAIKQELTNAGVLDFRLQPTTKIPEMVGSGLPGEYILPPSKELELYIKSMKQYRGKTKLLMKLGNDIINYAKEAISHEA